MGILRQNCFGCQALVKPSSLFTIFAIFAWFILSTGMVIANDEDDKSYDKPLYDIDPRDFSNSTNIDNKWWPMKPGTEKIYKGHTIEDGEEIPHAVIWTVTDLTKLIYGIRVVVIWERDIKDGRLEESELTFFAQDDKGNIWHLGQHREIFDEIELLGFRTWIVGHQEGTKAGIMMKADPEEGWESYSQGYAPPPFNWTDRAQTHKIGEKVKTSYGSFEDVLVVAESSDEEPGAFQLKYYAPGVGVISVGYLGEDPNKETLELVETKMLSPQEMAEARSEALKIEERAYIYGTTLPAMPAPMSGSE